MSTIPLGLMNMIMGQMRMIRVVRSVFVHGDGQSGIGSARANAQCHSLRVDGRVGHHNINHNLRNGSAMCLFARSPKLRMRVSLGRRSRVASEGSVKRSA